MKKIFYGMLLLILASGCAHTSTLDWSKPFPEQRSSSGKPVVWNIHAVNRGMYLFNLIPLWSGYETRPNRHEYKIGQDMLTRPAMRRMMDVHLDKWDADKVEDIQISESSSGAFSLWIVWRRTMTATGVAVKVVPDNEKTDNTDNK